MNDIKAAIEKLFADPNISNYRIEKDTGLKQAMLNKYKRGESKIGNMSLDNALTLYNYYQQLKSENEINQQDRDIMWGKIFAVCNVLSMRLFDKGKPAVFTTQFAKFQRQPMSTFTKIHEDLMQYTHKIKNTEAELFTMLDELIGNMNELDYTDEPLSQYPLSFHKQQHELRSYQPHR